MQTFSKCAFDLFLHKLLYFLPPIPKANGLFTAEFKPICKMQPFLLSPPPCIKTWQPCLKIPMGSWVEDGYACCPPLKFQTHPHKRMAPGKFSQKKSKEDALSLKCGRDLHCMPTRKCLRSDFLFR